MAKPNQKYVYKPEMCEQIIELGKQGATQKAMWSGIGISKGAAETFKKNYPEFAEAVSMATTESQAWWEREGIANLNNRAYNTRLYEVMTKAMFPEDYRERLDVKQEVKSEVTIDFNSAVNDLISTLKKAADNAA
jgi:hypothetical protein